MKRDHLTELTNGRLDHINWLKKKPSLTYSTLATSNFLSLWTDIVFCLENQANEKKGNAVQSNTVKYLTMTGPQCNKHQDNKHIRRAKASCI